MGEELYSGKVTFSGQLKLQDSSPVKNPASINFNPYKNALSSGVTLLGQSFTLSANASSIPGLKVASSILNTDTFDLKLGLKMPENKLTGKLTQKGLKFEDSGFHYELDLTIEVELSILHGTATEPWYDRVPTIPPWVIKAAFIFGLGLMTLLSGGAVLADSRDFEELRQNPALWDKFRRDLNQFRG